MGGFLGFQSGGEKQAEGNLQNVFNYGMQQGKAGQTTGQGSLDKASQYWSDILKPGRTVATQNAAPAVNAATDQADAQRKEAGTVGTGRTGGAVALQREAATTTHKTIDDIINANMTGGRKDAAGALAAIGAQEEGNAAQLLGLGTGAESSVLSEEQSVAQRQAAIGAAVGSAIGKVAFGALFPAKK